MRKGLIIAAVVVGAAAVGYYAWRRWGNSELMRDTAESWAHSVGDLAQTAATNIGAAAATTSQAAQDAAHAAAQAADQAATRLRSSVEEASVNGSTKPVQQPAS
jgi:hypothetical protein